MHICTYWRDVVLSTLSLWNYIHFTAERRDTSHGWLYYPPPSLLQYSRLTPLHVTVKLHDYEHRNQLKEPTKFYRSLRTVTDRAETLQIFFSGGAKTRMLDVLRSPLPHLTSLTLRLNVNAYNGLMEDPEMIFEGDLTQLRQLSLWFYTPRSRHGFANLTHIALHDQRVRPSINDFLNLLESTPFLEILFLFRAGPVITEGDLLPHRTISLPFLRSVHFESKSATEAYNIRILECLSIQPLTHCSVVSQAPAPVNQPPIPPAVVQKIVCHINLEEVTKLRTYHFKRDIYGLSVDGTTISIQSTIHTLVSVPSTRYRDHNIKSLHLFSTTRIPIVNWACFPNLFSITCYGTVKGIDELIMSLSRPCKNGCPCPLLDIIYLRVGERLPDPMHVNKPVDRERVQGMLNGFPENTVIHRSNYPTHDFQIAFELLSPFSDELQTGAPVKFPLH
ncbi:hypothetical protein M413DRAFT_32053 [Hebeloma cylindrosporum]|uniref:F-box domain-containing protein n=1 Tax=Hebeloma cylindrosporum TaxID=76867 RepID=A0A0C3BX28_HEBCY|nr:hypothetical protein M413DRAFT_32053 [Hebeloma cylindrosporum h7]